MDLVLLAPIGVGAVVLLLYGAAVAVALGHPSRVRRTEAVRVMEQITAMVRALLRRP